MMDTDLLLVDLFCYVVFGVQSKRREREREREEREREREREREKREGKKMCWNGAQLNNGQLLHLTLFFIFKP